MTSDYDWPHTPHRSSDLLQQLTDIFNTSTDFQDFVDADDTHTAVMPDVLSTLDPALPPAPGPLFADQLLKMITWTRQVTTKLVTKYDLSGHLDYGEARLRDLYENYCCPGARCPEPVDRPKVAAFMFAALGIIFNQVGVCNVEFLLL